MKKLSGKTRISHGILLLLFLIVIAAEIFMLHNYSLSLGGKTPVLTIVLIIITAILGIIMYRMITMANKQSVSNAYQLEQLRKSIEQSKAEELKRAQQLEMESKKVVIDTVAEAKALIPTESYSNIDLFAEVLLSSIAKKHDVVQGLIFFRNANSGKFLFSAGYAFFSEEQPREFVEGETLSGQVAKNKVLINLTNVPDGYITVLSGLGKGSPQNLIIAPILDKSKECLGIIEIASFKSFKKEEEDIFRNLGEFIGELIDNMTQSINE